MKHGNFSRKWKVRPSAIRFIDLTFIGLLWAICVQVGLCQTVETQAEETQTEQEASQVEKTETEDGGKGKEKSSAGREGPFKYKIGSEHKGLRRLMPDHDVWFDVKQKIVVANSEVVLNRGPLEMFACPPNTKEHESILRVKSAAFVIHAGLLAVGAKSGHPVKFDPDYEPATGNVVDIYLVWELDGKTRWAKAQDWVLNSQTRKPMKTHWVFAGSGYWVNPDNGTRNYLAETGELICVSNFSTATLDLPVESSQANAGLLFEANPDQVPPKGTPVKLVLAPQIPKKEAPKDAVPKKPGSQDEPAKEEGEIDSDDSGAGD